MYKSGYFIGIGAQKAGTTWLYRNFQHHPEIGVPPIKELHFFDEMEFCELSMYSKIRTHSWYAKRWRRKNKQAMLDLLLLKWRSFAWKTRYLAFPKRKDTVFKYQKYLDSLVKTHTKIVGEITPKYALLKEESIQLIKEYFPDLRIIYVLRNPIEREFSEYKMYLKKGLKGIPEIKDAKGLNTYFSKTDKRSDYVGTLTRWRKYFPESQIKVLFFEELKNNPLEFLNEAYRFLGVNEVYTCIQNKVYQGEEVTMPPAIKKLLNEKYRIQISELEQKLLKDHHKSIVRNWYSS